MDSIYQSDDALPREHAYLIVDTLNALQAKGIEGKFILRAVLVSLVQSYGEDEAREHVLHEIEAISKTPALYV